MTKIIIDFFNSQNFESVGSQCFINNRVLNTMSFFVLFYLFFIYLFLLPIGKNLCISKKLNVN
jgi:hypothetical protein